jgi:hypothetical protein
MRTRYSKKTLGAVALTAALAAPAAGLAQSGGTTPTLRLSAPATVHKNKLYRIAGSGHANAYPYQVLSVFIQTAKQGKCRSTPEAEATKAHAYEAIPNDGSPGLPVHGDYHVRSAKLADTKANGHDYVCGYLSNRSRTSPSGLEVVVHAQKRIRSIR